MASLIRETQTNVSRICAALRPVLIDEVGFEAAVSWYAGDFQQRTGITCSVDIALDSEPRTEAALLLYRILQESLTNVARHSGARFVTISGHQHRTEFELAVVDDGIGMDLTVTDAKRSLGLLGIRERARELGGSAEIGGRSGRGTTVRVVVPITLFRKGAQT
jgi:signal transduction histidine kinase